MHENRIEPWRKLPRTLSLAHRGETKGTKVIYDGVTLRARGEYSDDMAIALLNSLNHVAAEGIYC